VAAVVGRHAPRALLLTVTGQPEEEALAGLEAACRARLLLEEGEGYAFAHDVVREVVEADLGAARRAVLHRRVAEALEGERAGASPAALAYHYERGGSPDKAVVYLERAGAHALVQHAHAAAEGHYRAALDRLESLGRAQDALRVREKLGEVLKRTGRYEAAVQVLEPAAETYRAAGDWERLGWVVASMAEADGERGAFEEGMARIQPLLAQLERDGATAPPAALYLWWGVFLLTVSRYGEAMEALERAAELARAGGDERTLVRAAWSRADILQRSGQLEAALRASLEVLPLAEAMGDLEVLLSVHRNLAYIHALQGAPGTSRRHGDRALALAEQLENPPNRSFTLALCGWLAALAGDWRGAHAHLDQALALSRQLGPSWYSPYVLTFQARLSLAEGDRAAAAAALREAIALAGGSGELQALRWAATTLAEIEIMEGRAEAARAQLAPLLDRPGLQECDVTTLLPALAWAQLGLGQLDAAMGTVEQALERARLEGMRLVLVEALRVRALVALRRGQREEAARSLEEGLALARAMPYPYAEARLLHLAGALHAERGAAEAARAAVLSGPHNDPTSR
jgi:tetratricopeptide (TPR) repeat protein